MSIILKITFEYVNLHQTYCAISSQRYNKQEQDYAQATPWGMAGIAWILRGVRGQFQEPVIAGISVYSEKAYVALYSKLLNDCFLLLLLQILFLAEKSNVQDVYC